MQIKKNEKRHELRLMNPQTQVNPEHVYRRFLTSAEKTVNHRHGFGSLYVPKI